MATPTSGTPKASALKHHEHDHNHHTKLELSEEELAKHDRDIHDHHLGTLSSKGPKADLHKLKLLQQIEDDARARLVEVLGVDDEDSLPFDVDIVTIGELPAAEQEAAINELFSKCSADCSALKAEVLGKLKQA